MAGRDQPSSIDRLPDEIREQIGKLRVQGRTIDEILAHLKSMDVDISRSALGRHVKSMATLKERLLHSRQMATALVDRFGAEPDNKLQRLNLELMHGVILQTITAAEQGEDGEPLPVTFNPQEAMFLAGALKSLAGAEKTDADLRLRLKAEALKEAASAASKVARQAGLTRETVEQISHAILGVA